METIDHFCFVSCQFVLLRFVSQEVRSHATGHCFGLLALVQSEKWIDDAFAKELTVKIASLKKKYRALSNACVSGIVQLVSKVICLVC